MKISFLNVLNKKNRDTTIMNRNLKNFVIFSLVALGPFLAGASSGSVHQAALSYGSNKAITQITGKTPAENFKTFLMTSKEIESENANNFFKTIKKINENSSVKNLANQ